MIIDKIFYKTLFKDLFSDTFELKLMGWKFRNLWTRRS